MLREQIQDTYRAVEQEKEDKQVEFKNQQAGLMAQIHQLQSDMEILKVDKQSLLDDVERKQDANNRLKDQLQSDISRLEKKILAQVKTNEDLTHEHSAEMSSNHATISKLREEIQTQKAIIHDKTC